jgi:DNA invertase Pin-like site-specific DNA recombinase
VPRLSAGWRHSLLVTKLDRLARSTPDLYRIVSQLTERGIAFKVIDDPSIDTTSRTGKLIMGILALIAEFEDDIRRERQQDGRWTNAGLVKEVTVRMGSRSKSRRWRPRPAEPVRTRQIVPRRHAGAILDRANPLCLATH